MDQTQPDQSQSQENQLEAYLMKDGYTSIMNISQRSNDSNYIPATQKSNELFFQRFNQQWLDLQMPTYINLASFDIILSSFLFLKSDKQLVILDQRFKPSRGRELTASQMQRCLVETAFALLKPVKGTILTENAKQFVMALLRINISDLNSTLSAMLVKETQEFKLNIDGMIDFDNSNPPTSGVLSPSA